MKEAADWATRPDQLIYRQKAWIQAALALYPERQGRMDRLRWVDWVGARDTDCSEGEIRALLDRYLHQRESVPPFHENHYKTTFRLPSSRPGGHGVFLKSYRFHRLSGLNPRNWVRRLKPKKCFYLSYLLESVQVPTAKVLFYLKRRGGPVVEYLMATEELPSTEVLNRWLRMGIRTLDPGGRDAFMSRLGGYVGVVHRNGIYHRTLEFSIVVCADPIGFYLIDLDHVMTIGAILGYERKRQLGRFEELLTGCGATPADLNRFYSEYENQMANY